MNKPRPIHRGEIVRLTGYPRAVWKVVDVAEGLLHLTKLNSFDRLDYREVPAERAVRVHDFTGSAVAA